MGRSIIILAVLLASLVVWRRAAGPVVAEQGESTALENPLAGGGVRKQHSPIPSQVRQVKRTTDAGGVENNEKEIAVLAPYLQQGWSLELARRRRRLDQINTDGRATMRQQDVDKGINQDVWRREDELREKAKSLHLGMTAEEVVAILGKPTEGADLIDPRSPAFGQPETHASPAFPFGSAKTAWYYSPHPTKLMHREMLSPDDYQVLYVGFGNSNQLNNWDWLTPIH